MSNRPGAISPNMDGKPEHGAWEQLVLTYDAMIAGLGAGQFECRGLTNDAVWSRDVLVLLPFPEAIEARCERGLAAREVALPITVLA